MDINYYIAALNKIKPTAEEMVAVLDDRYKNDLEYVNDLLEDYDYKINATQHSFASEIFDVVYNSNICKKGIDIFHFEEAPQKEFAYNDQEHIFSLESGSVYVDVFGDCQLVSDSEDDFLLGLLYWFEVSIEFIYRRPRFDIYDILLPFVEKVPDRNSKYFVEQLMFMFPMPDK